MPESNTPSNKPSDSSSSSLVVEINDRQSAYTIPEARLCEAGRFVLERAGIHEGQLSLAVVDNQEMHELNCQFLAHDYPTDVLSFLLSDDGQPFEGEIIISAEYAAGESSKYRWRAEDEMLLYVIHGTLHLTGMDDHQDEDRQAMRDEEAIVLKHFGLEHRYEGGPEPVANPPESGEIR